MRELIEEREDAWRDLGFRPEYLPEDTFMSVPKMLYLRRGAERYDIKFDISAAEPQAPVKIVSLYQVDDSRGGQRMRGWYKLEYGTGSLWGYREDAAAMGHVQDMTERTDSQSSDLDTAATVSVFLQKWAEYAKQTGVRPEYAAQSEIDEALQIIREAEVITPSHI